MKFDSTNGDYFSSPSIFADLSRIKETVSIPTRTTTIMDKIGTKAELTESPETLVCTGSEPRTNTWATRFVDASSPNGGPSRLQSDG